MSKRAAEEMAEPTTPKRPRQTILSSTLTPTLPSLPPSSTVSAPIEDRKSKFIGYFLPCTTTRDLSRNKTLIDQLPTLKLADHKILAWNVGSSTGFDDDGEKWAGKRVLEILTSSQDEGLLCVARWYGGVMLGPVRFDHIVHVAADALATYHLQQRKSPVLAEATIRSPGLLMSPGSGGVGEKERLVRMLRGKDMSVESLRGMIAEKKKERGESVLMSPVKEKGYDRMGMEVLKRLVTARDATIKSLRDILKELNQASTELEGSTKAE
jgi:Uncharacterized protein family UPF0029